MSSPQAGRCCSTSHGASTSQNHRRYRPAVSKRMAEQRVSNPPMTRPRRYVTRAGSAARVLQGSQYTPAQVRTILLSNAVSTLDAATLNTYDYTGTLITGTPNK